MKSIKLSLFGALGLLLVLPGCVKEYKKTSLKPLSKQTAHFEQAKNNVTLRVKKFDADDCQEAFSGRGKNLVKGKNAIYLLHVSVENRSNNVLMFDKQSIAMRLAETEQVYNRLRTSTGGRTAGAFLSAFGGTALAVCAIFQPWLLIPAGVCFATAARCDPTHAAIAGLCVAIAYGVIIVAVTSIGAGSVAGAIAGHNSSKANTKLQEDLQGKALQDGPLFIQPNQRVDMLVFVAKKDYRNEFSLILKNAADEKDTITFDVVLPEED